MSALCADTRTSMYCRQPHASLDELSGNEYLCLPLGVRAKAKGIIRSLLSGGATSRASLGKRHHSMFA